MRALIDIPDDQARSLAEIVRRTGASRAALVRQAIDEFIATRDVAPLEASFGLWRGAEDGLAYQRRLRSQW